MKNHQYRQYLHEIDWLNNRIVELSDDKARKSHDKQIRQYRHQIRHTELTIAFDEITPSWRKDTLQPKDSQEEV